MQFFIPHTTKARLETKYQDLSDIAQEQLRAKVTDQRIFSINYIQDKKRLRLAVGEFEQQENRYKILAILESSPYIVCTRTKEGLPGITILVNKDDVTDIEYFD
ncbi:MAG TPA: hypothetical protein VNA68_01095 [Candidatus Dormibacteraeota bacterium]|nr:hypothetical protein [Candidatus Dormibacteraeota bacterium]